MTIEIELKTTWAIKNNDKRILQAGESDVFGNSPDGELTVTCNPDDDGGTLVLENRRSGISNIKEFKPIEAKHDLNTGSVATVMTNGKTVAVVRHIPKKP